MYLYHSYGKETEALIKKLFCFLMLSLLLLTGCSAPAKVGNETPSGAKKTDAPIYERTTSRFQLAEDANPYMTDYGQNGFFYFIMGAKEKENEYQFYYQPYDAEEAVPFCVVAEGYVRDFSGITIDGKLQLSVLRIGEEAVILKYDEAGKPCGEIVIDDMFNSLEEFPKLLAMADGGYAVGMSNQVFLLNAEGQITEKFNVDGSVNELYMSDENELFVTAWRDDGKSSALWLTRLKSEKGKAEELQKLPEGLVGLFAFDNGFVSVFGDLVTFFQAGKEDEEVLIDLDRQGFSASQLRYIYGNREEINLISMEQSDTVREVYHFTLKKLSETGDNDETKELSQELYAPDGRRIVRVAIPKGCLYQVEFHARKYNQISDKTFIEVERFDDSLENYLGKGNRPDVIMFNEHTEIDEYIQKGILENLLPLFEGQERYFLEDIIPKVRELLGAESEDGMYAMAGRFRLLLQTSDGGEYASDGNCDVISYLKWYDKFMTENEISGIGSLENLLFANVSAFYDENTAETSFASEEFYRLMQTYKAVSDCHKGSIDYGWSTSEEGYIEGCIARGSKWCAGYGQPQLAWQDVKLEGVPGLNGESRVYMRLDYPMSILKTSDCKEAAFDFIMYYNSLAELLLIGDTEGAYGKSGNTYGYFSVYEENLKKEIYESEKPYASIRDGEYFFTEEQNAQLRDLLDRAVFTTRTQKDIYNMLMEEMGAYFKGDKDLDSACEILRNRAELYLEERL